MDANAWSERSLNPPTKWPLLQVDRLFGLGSAFAAYSSGFCPLIAERGLMKCLPASIREQKSVCYQILKHPFILRGHFAFLLAARSKHSSSGVEQWSVIKPLL